ncbi:MAG TPA: hypothetical protein PLI13_13790 [Paracoccus sp. (in: a-proteobacteria)]|nr:hypothetical protein [Paracoccus sp. (in: a-proteobacteria)]
MGLIGELLIPEAQPDPYVWAAVLLAHAAIGAALYAALVGVTRRPLMLVALIYAGWEVLQAAASGALLVLDSAVDLSAVMIGAVLALGLWHRRAGVTRLATLAAAIIAIIGYRRRDR